jgi:hypothetical protein
VSDTESTLAALSALTARVQELEDERAVRATLQRYCHAIDHGDEAVWVDLFVPDARVETHESQAVGTPPAPPLLGHHWLARVAARHTRAPEKWHQHVVANLMITIHGDTARVESYFFLLMDEAGEREIAVFGRYHDQLVRCADGRWRFQERIIHVDSTNGRSVMRPRPVAS